MNDGGKEEPLAIIGDCLGLGIAREARARAAIGYLKGRLDAIAVDGPSLGTYRQQALRQREQLQENLAEAGEKEENELAPAQLYATQAFIKPKPKSVTW